jgi:dihydroflavonol-4-reductase
MTPMRVYVTGGGRGFVGAHVVRELREAGHEVRDDWADVRSLDPLVRAVEGCEAVCHVAALYSYTAPAAKLESVNVLGTANVLEACRRAGISRVVHTSTCGTCGPVPGRAATEADAPPAWELAVPYKRTKLEAEQLALDAGAVCVNPTTPVGDGDTAPTPTGEMVRGVASGRYRLALRSTGLNLVDVRDVARGHVLALERGRAGERYLLGGVDLTLADVFTAVARIAGRRPPLLSLPWLAARALAAARVANEHEVALARVPAWFSSAKGQRELGYRPGPVEPALARAVAELARWQTAVEPVTGAPYPRSRAPSQGRKAGR